MRSCLAEVRAQADARSDRAVWLLYRDRGKTPAFFDAAQIEALVLLHRSELSEGNFPGHREADEDDF
jgi:hypothetical protein